MGTFTYLTIKINHSIHVGLKKPVPWILWGVFINLESMQASRANKFIHQHPFGGFLYKQSASWTPRETRKRKTNSMGLAKVYRILPLLLTNIHWNPQPSFLGVSSPIFWGFFKPSFFHGHLGSIRDNLFTIGHEKLHFNKK